MPSDRPVPIFVISFNRSTMLERCVAALQGQSVAVDVVVHDNGSDDLAALSALDRLEASGVPVYHRGPIQEADDLENVEATIRDRIGEPGTRPDFVVTDCDVDLSTAQGEALSVYAWLLDRHPEAHCVGPMLTIADIPDHYPLRERALRGHIDQFWGRIPDVEDSPFGLLASIPAPIDTTLALHRGSERFRRLRMGRRVYHPYEARHLDWYLARADLQRGESDGISHWSSEEWFEQERSVRAGATGYFTVERAHPHTLSITKRHATDPPVDPVAIESTDSYAAYEDAKLRLAGIHRAEVAALEVAVDSGRHEVEALQAALDRSESDLARSRRRARLAVAAGLSIGAVAGLIVAAAMW